MYTNTLYFGREWNVDHNQRVKVSNAELRYAVLGSGEPILCIHGTNVADSLITPLQFYPPLFEEYQLISYYRAGYNGSTLEKSVLTIEEGAEHAKQLLDHLGIQKGTSWHSRSVVSSVSNSCSRTRSQRIRRCCWSRGCLASHRMAWKLT